MTKQLQSVTHSRPGDEHRFSVRVYYEDTDMGGIVYHANYLKFIERARSDWVRGLGVDQVAMKEDGIAFAVRRVEADYLMAAKFDHQLEVLTRGEDLIFSAVVTIVCISDAGQPVRLPANIRLLLH